MRIRLNPVSAHHVGRLATRQGRSPSDAVDMIITDYVFRQHGKTAPAEVEVVSSQEQMQIMPRSRRTSAAG